MLAAACTGAAPDHGGDGADGGDGGDVACDYPAGATEPMALGEVITPYRWPSARTSAGVDVPLDLGVVPCDADPDIDWSPFDVLLFVSIPAW